MNARGPSAVRLSPGRLVVWLLLTVPFCAAHRVLAHDELAAYIQHRIAVAVDARNIDITVQLTFFEIESRREREKMDADKNGRITRAETEQYLRKIEEKLADAISARIPQTSPADGVRLEMAALRDPELDLLGFDGVGLRHHRLTLCFFARTPPNLVPGSELVIEDRLWSAVKAVGSIQADGESKYRVSPVPLTSPLLPPVRGTEPRIFRVLIDGPGHDTAPAPTVQTAPPTKSQ